MPEGPIIVILKEAAEQFNGKKIIAAVNDNHKLDTSLFEGQTVTGFKSHGKNFFICFKHFNVRIHLMMFGSYTINEHKARKPRLGLQFANGELNFYTCVVEMIEGPLDELYDWHADVMNQKWSSAKAVEKLQDKPKALACDVLLDQHIFAGAGNIIKNEVLFRTKIHPKSLIGSIPTRKLKEMVDEVATYSFEFLKWKKEFTLKKHWKAYGQKICPRNKVPFHKADLGKTHRGCYYCDLCQVLYA